MQGRTGAPRGGVRRFVVAGSLAVLLASVPGAPAQAGYATSSQVTSTATVPGAVELSGMVASPTHPGWYWAHSDVWKSSDAFAACADTSGAALAECQQVQRARLWAVRIDDETHKVVAARSFALDTPAWATDPVVAQNNDWEDIAFGPRREDGTVNLVVGALGNSVKNPVLDSDGVDRTCDTRRLIELAEPDLSDPAATTWTPRAVFDIKNPVGLGPVTSCNFETLLVGQDGAGEPTAYLVSRAQRRIVSRTLAESTGRPPGEPVAAPGSGLPHEPSAQYVGTVKDATGLQLTAGDSNASRVSLVARRTSTQPCRVLTWSLGGRGLGAVLTGTTPTKSVVGCNGAVESLTYARGPADPSVATDDLYAVSDSGGSSKFTVWWFPDT
ncbi:MAG: hypothetical protein AVDCRST_MAG36-846 [uncultured Nocardioidaceae bacterium]|uniref:Secreted protein n=1 Tax=uncultured Nocardioidaceae bacterium TaxID=253824 RepID=A0A6J4LDV7_9ACTN|nr:MAG: hypothetical protein AVDCRST_MAG36-846 [uncultured Nocardioidaceae bacterium]